MCRDGVSHLLALRGDPRKPARRELLCKGEELNFPTGLQFKSPAMTGSEAQPDHKTAPDAAQRTRSMHGKCGASPWAGKGLCSARGRSLCSWVQLNQFGDVQLPHQLQHPHCCAQQLWLCGPSPSWADCAGGGGGAGMLITFASHEQPSSPGCMVSSLSNMDPSARGDGSGRETIA